MDSSGGPSLYPLHRCKILHFVGVEFMVHVYKCCIDLNSDIFCIKDIQDHHLPWLLLMLSNCNLINSYMQVRHAQGIHNVDGEKNYKAYMNPEYFDAQLTPLGWQQVETCSFLCCYVVMQSQLDNKKLLVSRIKF